MSGSKPWNCFITKHNLFYPSDSVAKGAIFALKPIKYFRVPSDLHDFSAYRVGIVREKAFGSSKEQLKYVDLI